MTTAATLEHEEFCLPRPGADEPRIESYTYPRYATDGTTVVSFALITRCQECGEQVIQG